MRIQDGKISRQDARELRARRDDLRRAENLRKSASLRKNRKPGTGPAIAR